MMIRPFSAFFALCALGFHLQAQIVSTTDSAFGPSAPTLLSGTPTTATVSTCVDSLVVQIPTNRWVYSVDVAYDMLAANNGWKSEQFSYLSCTSTATAEATISQGVGNQPGLQLYSRTGLTIANGATATGQLVFALHAFRTWGGNGCDTNINKVVHGSWVITVHHGPMPTCFPPTGLQLDWVMSNSAEFTWTTGGATNWQMKYGAVGFNPTSTGTFVSSGATTKRVNGLNASTPYDVYVRDSCGTGNSSMWVGPLPFSTLCAPLAAPYLETFSGTGWTQGTGALNANNAIDVCWTRDPNAPTGNGFGQPYAWGPRSGPTPSANTGPTADHTTGTPAGKYLYTEASGGGYQDQAEVVSPLMDISGLTNPSVTFWKHMFGQYTGTLALDVWTPTNGWQYGIWSQSGATQASSAAGWDSINVPFVGLSNDTIRIRFRGVRSFDVTGDMALDDIYFQNGPTCPQPTGLTSTNINFTSVDLSILTGAGTSWQIAYGTTVQTPGAMAKTGVTTTTPTLNGLTTGTDYAVYVRNICGAGDTSGWFGPLLVSTLCTPVSAPWAEDFDGTAWTAGTGTYNAGDALATCWFRDPEAGSGPGSPYYWGIRAAATTTPNTGPNADASGNGRFAYTESSSGLPGQVTYLRTPPINTSTLTSPALSFSYHARGNSMGTLGFQVWTPTGGWSATTNVFSGNQPFFGNNAPWIDTAFILPASDTLMIRFVATRGSANQSDMAIDEIEIKEAPACPAPTGFSVGIVTATTAGLSWTTGGATEWNVAFGPVGAVNMASFNTATTNPYTLAGLMPGTTYEVYVRDSCGSGTSSLWVGPLTFTTLCTSITAPWSENFDGSNWVTSTHFQAGDLDPCWDRSATTTFWWKAETGATPTGNTGPLGDHTSGTGKYLHTETSNGVTPTWLVSPVIKLDTLSNPELSFFYHMFGNQIQKMEVEIRVNGGAWSNLWTATGAQQSAQNAPWSKAAIPLVSYAGDSVQVRWFGYRNWGNQNQVDMSIDDVVIDNAQPCIDPTALATVVASPTSVQVSWNATSGGTTFIEYGATGFTPGAGTMVQATSNPFVVTGLTSGTAYDFYVLDSCAANDLSNHVGPSAATPIACANACTYTLHMTDSYGDGWVGNNFGTAQHQLQLTVGAMSTFYTFTTGFDSTTVIPVCDGDTIYMQFFVNGNWSNECGWYLIDSNGDTAYAHDDNTTIPAGVHFSGGVSCSACPVPSALSASGATANSLTLTWTSGGATAWQIEYGPVGFTQGAGTTVAANTNPFTVTGLNASNTYDFYVRDVCSSSLQSNWVGPVSGSTACGVITAPYAENFDATFASGTGNFNQNSTIDPCWTRNPAAGTGGPPFNQPYHWGGGTGTTPTASTGPMGDHTTGNGHYVYVEASAFNGAAATLTTPQIYLDTLSNPEVVFWRHMLGTQIGTLNVDVSANGGAWINVSTAQGSQGNNWQEVKANLSAYAGDTVQLRFTANKPGGGNQASGDIAIDDLTINNPLPCLPPSNISVQAFSNTSLEVTFTAGGGGTTMIEYGPAGFTPGLGILVAASTNPFIIPGLLSSTAYDVYVFDSCGIGQVSPKLGPFSQTTFSCQNGCQYTLDLVDTYGDGWIGNGAGTVSHNLEITTGTSVTNFTFNAGFATSFTINVCDMDTLRVRFLANGAWAEECGWYLMDSFGDTVSSFTPGTVPGTGYLLEDNIQCSNPCPTPVADFTYTTNGLLVVFSATGSTGNNLQYSWNYGTGGTAIGVSATYNFPQDSTWDVQLVVTDLCGQTDTLVIPVTVCSSTIQTFTTSTSVLTLNCTGPVNPGRYASIWFDFGNGQTVQGANASYTYPVGGNYTVTLYAVNHCGDTVSTSQNITMCMKPMATFTWFVVSSNGNGMTVQFDATASVMANTYTWYWGDGQTSTGANFIQHTYSVPSLLYNVTLIVTNNCGLADTVTHRLDELSVDENGQPLGAWLYPNPTTSIQGLTLAGWLAQDAVTATLTDAFGRTIQVLTLYTNAAGEGALPFKPVSAGLYFVRIQGETREQVLRFILEK
jgi:hypothetical protein